MSQTSPITTHVLDISRGRPARGVPVRLLSQRDSSNWQLISDKVTDDDGRIRDLMPEGSLTAGTYRLEFSLSDYFQTNGVDSFYPEASITFVVKNPAEHHHVPLLLSPFGYSTYRGS
jgi:5-hydroxyisourate hydrolase